MSLCYDITITKYYMNDELRATSVKKEGIALMTEYTIETLAATYMLPLAVRRSNWFGDFYFVIEEITRARQARGKRYKNGNYYDDWSCTIYDYVVLNNPSAAIKKTPEGGVSSAEEKVSTKNELPNPNNLILDKSRYIKGVTKLFVQRNEQLLSVVFDHFEIKNGKDVIYVKDGDIVSFYPFPQTAFVFPNKDDGTATLSKKKRTLTHETTDSSFVINAYSKLPLAQKPSSSKEDEFTHEIKHHKRVNDKLLQDLYAPKQAIVAAQDTIATANEDYREACIDARENGGYFDEHTFISLQMRYSDADEDKKTAEKEIRRIESVRNKPYFARVDCGKSATELHSAYIGDADIPGYVVDWRRPEIGNAYYLSSVLQARGDIVLALKRTFDIRHAELLDFDDEINIYHSDSFGANEKELGNSTDSLLTKLLSISREDKTTHDIIKTIQSEQYDIITSDFYKNAVINGCAGSGKTMILYHRLSYMAYNHCFRTGEPFDPQRVYVISPSDYFDAGNSALLQKLSIDTIHHAPFEKQISDLVYKYCLKYQIFSFSNILGEAGKPNNEPFNIYEDESYNQFQEYLESIDSIPNVKRKYIDWINNTAWHLLAKGGFEVTDEKEEVDINEVFDRWYHSEIFVKKRPDKKKKKDSLDEKGDDNVKEYYLKEAITSISYENVIASLESLSKTGNTYRSRLKKITQFNNTLRMCLSSHTRRYSNSEIKTDIRDFWNILENPIVFEKISVLIIAEELLNVATGKAYSSQDYLLRCAFAYQNIFSAQYTDKSCLYYLKALAHKYGSLVQEPSFLFVDEFQNYSVFELQCLKSAFANPIFNLYGDFDQRIEEKGVGLQSALDDMLSPQIYNLNINYRNAKQITEYINTSVYKNMQPIGVDGTVSEVHYFDCHFLKKDRTAIIAKDIELVSSLLKLRFGQGFFKVAAETKTIDDNALMLLSVSECKGLEFDTVYVFSDGMTENEKYVAYTRALDCLSVIPDKNISEIKAAEEERIIQKKAKREKPKKLEPIGDIDRKQLDSASSASVSEQLTENIAPEERFVERPSLQEIDLPEEPSTTDQCDDIYLEAMQLFSSENPDELSYAISLLERILNVLSKKLSSARETREEQIRANYRAEKRCQYCGGSFTGFFKKVCRTCGRKKDY